MSSEALADLIRSVFVIPLTHDFRLEDLRGLNIRWVIRIDPHDFWQHLHAFHDPPKDGVLAIEEGRRQKIDKKLRASRVDRLLLRHAETACEVIAVIVIHAFAIDVVAGSTTPGPFGAAGLSHEGIQDAMKDQLIVKAFLHETDKIANRFRGLIFKQLQDNIAGGRLQSNTGKVICRCLLPRIFSSSLHASIS